MHNFHLPNPTNPDDQFNYRNLQNLQKPNVSNLVQTDIIQKKNNSFLNQN